MQMLQMNMNHVYMFVNNKAMWKWPMTLKTFCTIVDTSFHIVPFLSTSLVTSFFIKIEWIKMVEDNRAWTIDDCDYTARDIPPFSSPVRRISGLTVPPRRSRSLWISPQQMGRGLWPPSPDRWPSILPPLVGAVTNPQLGWVGGGHTKWRGDFLPCVHPGPFPYAPLSPSSYTKKDLDLAPLSESVQTLRDHCPSNQWHPLAHLCSLSQIILPTQTVRFPITLLSPIGEQIDKWTSLMTYL